MGDWEDGFIDFDWEKLDANINFLQGGMFGLLSGLHDEIVGHEDAAYSYADRVSAILSLFTQNSDFDSPESLLEQTKSYLVTKLGKDPFETLGYQFLSQIASLVYNIRASIEVVWYLLPDPLFCSSVLDLDRVDYDTTCAVAGYNGQIHVRCTLPTPEIYWQANRKSNIYFCGLTLYEELTHMLQIRPNTGTRIGILNLEIPHSSGDDETKRFLRNLIREAEVTHRLTDLMPEVEGTQWFADRVNSSPHDSHHPHPISVTWALAYTIWNVEKLPTDDFYIKTAPRVSRLARHNPKNREAIFGEDSAVEMVRQAIGTLARVIKDNHESQENFEAISDFHLAFINYCIEGVQQNPDFLIEYDQEVNKGAMLKSLRGIFNTLNGFEWVLDLAGIAQEDIQQLRGLSFDEAIRLIAQMRSEINNQL